MDISDIVKTDVKANVTADLSDVANNLINKIAGAFGIVPAAISKLHEPTHIKRIAKAKAKAELEVAKIDIEKRALLRVEHEQIRAQNNIENVTKLAVDYLKEDAKPENIDDDWLHEFFEKAKKRSDKEFQNMWAKILAGEANKANSFSYNSMDILSKLSKEDARLFENLCKYVFVWGSVNSLCPFMFEDNHIFYLENKLNFISLQNLASLGLITYSNTGTVFNSNNKEPGFVFFHYGMKIISVHLEIASVTFKLGRVSLTTAGYELYSLCNEEKIEGYAEYVLSEFIKQGHKATIINLGDT